MQWLVHERLRYETLATADVDNTLKVTLDSLCGPDGVLINDCQVQSVSCHWIDWISDEQQLTIVIRHSPDDWVRKGGLVFVRANGHLCWPVSEQWPTEALHAVLDHLEKAVELSKEALRITNDWHLSRLPLPIQQPFHSGRLHGFTIRSIAELRDRLTHHL